MDFLTNHYKYKCEILQEQIKILEQRYKELLESEAPASVFRGTGQGQQAFGDQELESQMRRFKKGGLFQQVKDEDQTQEYRDAKAELDRRRASNQSSNTTSTPEASPTTAAPTLLQRVPGQPDAGWNRPRTTPMPPNQPPHPMDLSKSSKPRKTTQSGNRPPNLIARDPDMPAVAGIDVEGPPSPIDRPSSKSTEQPRSGPNSPDINAERDLLRTDWARGEMEKLGVSPTRPAFNSVESADDIVNRTAALIDSMKRKESSATTKTPSSAPSVGQTSQQTNSIASPTPSPASAPTTPTSNTKTNTTPSPIATTDYGRKPVQATSDPLVSTFKAGSFIDKPDSSGGIGKIQLDPSDLTDPDRKKWAQKQLEAEVMGIPSVAPPTANRKPPSDIQRAFTPAIDMAKTTSFVKNLGPAMGERIADLFGGANFFANRREQEMSPGSSLMPKPDKIPSKLADYVDSIANAGLRPGQKGAGLARELLRGQANQIRRNTATDINPNARAAKAKYDQEMQDMLRRGI